MRQARFLVVILLLAGLSSPALAVKRKVLKQLRSDYAQHLYQLRLDLRDERFPVAPNVLNEKGIQYQGPDFRVLFYQMETVFLDRISNEKANSISLTLYRSRADSESARQITPTVPHGSGTWTDTPNSFSRDLSTSVTLEISAGKDAPIAQREQIVELFNDLFYLKGLPTYRDRESFIIGHPNLPAQRLAELSGFSVDVVKAILESREEN